MEFRDFALFFHSPKITQPRPRSKISSLYLHQSNGFKLPSNLAFFSRGYAKHRNDYLLGGRLCKCVTHSDVNFWPRTWRVWVWVSCRPPKLRAAILVLVKYLKLWEVWILLLWWCIGHNSAASEVKELIQVEVRRCSRKGDLVYWMLIIAFFLAREFDGFPLAFL